MKISELKPGELFTAHDNRVYIRQPTKTVDGQTRHYVTEITTCWYVDDIDVVPLELLNEGQTVCVPFP